MIPDETIMAYADGQLDPIAAKHVERAIADDPALAAKVKRERALRDRLANAFAPVAAEPVPVALTNGLRTNVVPVRPSPRRRWIDAMAIAATLVLGVAVGQTWQNTPIDIAGGQLSARGALKAALDGDLSGGTGPTRMLASFRATDGHYCRIFAVAAINGIACRNGEAWAVVRTQSAKQAPSTAYAQAGSPTADMMAAAQDMMAGQPLDDRAERTARDRRWH